MIGALRYFDPRYWASRYWPKVGAAAPASPAIVCVLEAETLSVPRYPSENLRVPNYARETFRIPVYPRETLRC